MILWVRNRHGLAESPNSESLKSLQSEFEPELGSYLRLDRGSICFQHMYMVVGRAVPPGLLARDCSQLPAT